MKRKPFKHSLATITALLVLLMAGLAGGSLWILRGMHGQAAHAAATRLVLSEGTRIVAHLAAQKALREAGGSDADWTAFSRQVGALHSVQAGLQYVAVTRDEMVVFHEQTRGLSAERVIPSAGDIDERDVSVARKVIDLAGEAVPVVVFRRTFTTEDGVPCEIEIAMRKDTVEREERSATAAIGSMFKLSLLSVIVSFASCALLVVWMMRREAQRERQRREEEHLAFAGVLANGIVHDFRNPMSSMRLDVQMLDKEVARGEACNHARLAELAGRVRSTIDRLDKVFQEFLYMSKPPSDEREVIDLAASVKECVAMLTARLEQAEVRVDIDTPTNPVNVLAYPSALQRAIMNVITNAEQVSRAGGAIQVRLVRSGRMATMDVIDSGPGVPESERRRIFEMFFTTRPGGTGLGLFLAKTAIDRCGGEIKVLDTNGLGACFRITLPLANEV